MEIYVAILKDFGFPIALSLLLMWAIRQQNTLLVKAYTDRISTLERIVRDLTGKVDDLERDRIARSDEYGHTLKGIAVSWANATRETNSVIRDTLAVMRRLCDSIQTRPCMIDGYQPHNYRQNHARTPSSAEVPPDPRQEETDKLHRSHA